ncbi:MAG: methylated-DNA--[protein]-cysteine S-methyltransferase [Chloroflexota bacterium]
MTDAWVATSEIATGWGTFGAVLTPAGLARLTFPDEPWVELDDWVKRWAPRVERRAAPERAAEVARQLRTFLEGKRREFDLPLDLRGTPFQTAVWRALRDIPFGRTVSYRDLASAIGQPTATRAVGAANGRNPVPIVVPCHRVIGANGTLTGYGGGLPLKSRLLALEGVNDSGRWRV